jgi:hypothetical protein
MKEATDFFMLHGKNMKVACRIRTPGFDVRYPWDFTVRSELDGGTKTELAKIKEGMGDWFFYAHAEHKNPPIRLHRYFLIDLHHFRTHLSCSRRRKAIVWEKGYNVGSRFIAFDIRSFLPDPPIWVARSHTWPEMAPRYQLSLLPPE